MTDLTPEDVAGKCEGRVVVRGFYGSDRCELDAGHDGPHRFVTTVTKYTTEIRNELIASGICTCSDPGFTHARELHDWLAALLTQAVETAREEGAGDLAWHRRDGAREALAAAADDSEAIADLIHPHMRAVRDRGDYLVGPAAQEATEDIQGWLRERGGVS